MYYLNSRLVVRGFYEMEFCLIIGNQFYQIYQYSLKGLFSDPSIKDLYARFTTIP